MTPVIDINDIAVQMLPPDKRLPKFEIMAQTVLCPVDRLNKIFQMYQNGDGVSDWWDASVAYNKGDRTKDFFGVYEAVTGNIGQNPLGDKGENWYKILPCYIGATERSKYCANKVVFEYALNRYLGTRFWDYTDDLYATPLSDIYILTDEPAYTSFMMSAYSGSPLSYMYPSGSTGYLLDPAVYGGATSFKFTIYVPAAFYASLGPTAEQIIRFFANKLCLSGITYTIQTY